MVPMPNPRDDARQQQAATAWGTAKSRAGTLSTPRGFMDMAAATAKSAKTALSRRGSKRRPKGGSKKVQPAAVPTMASFGMTGDLEGALYARVLSPKLERGDARERQWTARALGSIGPEAVSQTRALQRALEDEDAGVRQAAKHALLSIRGKSAEPEPSSGPARHRRRRRAASRQGAGSATRRGAFSPPPKPGRPRSSPAAR
mmetsp:Transcript_6882/g.20280  ORF Transcript_6882/g.20280 Transcript_6882/m.20280 type:complete len:202 (-) Transcript_6882:133-738(-)